MLLQLHKVSKMYGVTSILTDISLQLETRDRVALIGVNGAGKTTLLQIITGNISPDSGQIALAKGKTIGYLTQAHNLDEQRTIHAEMLDVFAAVVALERQVRDVSRQMSEEQALSDERRLLELATAYSELNEQFEAAGGYAYEARIRSVLHGMGFADFSPETPIATLSGGQKTRLALCKLLLRQPDLLILDEPTNHLDIETIEWLEAFLRAYPGAVLLVSHDRFFLDAVATVVYELERTRARRYAGNYSFYLEAKAANAEQERKEYEKQQTEIARLEDFVQRNLARASTSKRAQSRRRSLERMDRLARPAGDLRKAQFSFTVVRHSGKDVLQVNRLGFEYDGESRALFSNLDFDLKRGDSVALLGANGVGKSTLLQLLVGKLSGQSGEIRWGHGVQLGFYEQEQQSLNPGNTVLDEVWNAFPHLEEVRIRSVLGHFLFSGEDVFKQIAGLSGGEKARVALAKLMLGQYNVLVLDEPTNHLDVHSKEKLEEALIDYEGTILFISHDRYFINRLAEKVMELTPHGLFVSLGDYDDYQRKKAALTAANTADAGVADTDRQSQAGERRAPSATQRHNESSKQAKRDERARQRQIERLEQEIESLEQEISTIEGSLHDPQRQQDYLFLQEQSALLETKKATLDEKFEQWQVIVDS